MACYTKLDISFVTLHVGFTQYDPVGLVHMSRAEVPKKKLGFQQARLARMHTLLAALAVEHLPAASNVF